MSSPMREKLLALVEPLAAGLGYELVDLEFVPGRGSGLLRVYIDREAGVGIEDCERLSHELSALLDVSDPIPGAYRLEVSTPGFDRVLRTPQHFARFIGERAEVELAVARDGRRRYTGRLLESDDLGFVMEVDGAQVAVRYDELARCRLAPEWPQPGQKGGRR